jgi:RNA recognition motif-containing protein
MFNAVLVNPVCIIVVSMFSLAWFVVGLSAGRRLAPAQTGKPAEKKSGARSERTELYVGNLPYDLKSKDLRRTFEEFGKVQSVRIIENKFTGKSKGFAFVEMASKADASAAIKGMNAKELSGRKLVVNEAKTRAKD